MGPLDGEWEVERERGVLPPLVGFQKRIAGARGVTAVGPVAVPFDVDGLRLRYRFPLAGLVDQLEPEDGGYRGRALYRGRELGSFRMRRVERTGEGQAMEMKDVLTRHIDEAIAMEQNVLRMLDSMIKTTDDPEIKDEFREHRLATERQSDRLRARLDAHGAQPSKVREVGGIVGAVMKGVVDVARGEKAGRNARDGYTTEHMEIAAYELLERVAERAGDPETAQVARQNRAEEEQMARAIAEKWDRFVELSLREEGVTA